MNYDDYRNMVKHLTLQYNKKAIGVTVLIFMYGICLIAVVIP